MINYIDRFELTKNFVKNLMIQKNIKNIASLHDELIEQKSKLWEQMKFPGNYVNPAIRIKDKQQNHLLNVYLQKEPDIKFIKNAALEFEYMVEKTKEKYPIIYEAIDDSGNIEKHLEKYVAIDPFRY